MSQDQRLRAVVLALLCVGYVLLFVPANRTGADNAIMLSAFQLDEFAQYRALWRMTEPSDTVGEAISPQAWGWILGERRGDLPAYFASAIGGRSGPVANQRTPRVSI